MSMPATVMLRIESRSTRREAPVTLRISVRNGPVADGPNCRRTNRCNAVLPMLDCAPVSITISTRCPLMVALDKIIRPARRRATTVMVSRSNSGSTRRLRVRSDGRMSNRRARKSITTRWSSSVSMPISPGPPISYWEKVGTVDPPRSRSRSRMASTWNMSAVTVSISPTTRACPALRRPRRPASSRDTTVRSAPVSTMNPNGPCPPIDTGNVIRSLRSSSNCWEWTGGASADDAASSAASGAAGCAAADVP